MNAQLVGVTENASLAAGASCTISDGELMETR